MSSSSTAHVAVDGGDLPRGKAGWAIAWRRATRRLGTNGSRPSTAAGGGRPQAGLEVFVALGLATGARRGELLALRWADVDLEAGVVRIERSLQLVGGKLHVKLPKSEAGKRLVPLPRSAVGELRRHRAAQTERRLMIGPRYDTAADLVVAKADGAPFRPDYVSGAFRALVRRAGLPAAIHVHTLRHTVGSWLADAGVPPHDIAAILGHRDAGFTLRTFVHSLPDALRRAADTLDDALGGRP